MQVNSSVAASYYTSYRSNTSVKYHAGYTQAQNGDLLPNEKTAEEGFAEFVDYQEFHMAWMSQNGSRTIAENEAAGKFLGIAMVPEEGQSVTYGMRAKLLDSSTADNPIVQVVSQLGGKKVVYNVEVNKVDPSNATQLEMFALLSYSDEMGITDGGSLGSYQKLKVYGKNAALNGYCGDLSGEIVFVNEKFDWSAIMEKMMKDYYDAGITGQYEQCKELVDFFKTITVKIEDAITVTEETSALLTAESTTCTYPTANPDDDDILYVTMYTEESIYCKKLGEEDWEWSLRLENQEQYNKVMNFLNKFPSDWNMRFAAHKNFWTDFLNDKIDMDAFIQSHIDALYEKIKNGDTEVRYQIGAQEFSEEEWNKLLERFDEAEKELREQMQKEYEARKEEVQEEEQEKKSELSK